MLSYQLKLQGVPAKGCFRRTEHETKEIFFLQLYKWKVWVLKTKKKFGLKYYKDVIVNHLVCVAKVSRGNVETLFKNKSR